MESTRTHRRHNGLDNYNSIVLHIHNIVSVTGLPSRFNCAGEGKIVPFYITLLDCALIAHPGYML